jgi:hypothetical protein
MNSASGSITDLIIEDQKVLPEVSGPLLLCGEKREEDWERRSRDDWTRDEPARDDWTRDEPARDDWTRDEGERVWEACCFDIISCSYFIQLISKDNSLVSGKVTNLRQTLKTWRVNNTDALCNSEPHPAFFL